jgi:hypothetical protein
MERWQKHFKDILNPTATEMLPTTSSPSATPTDKCDMETEKEEKMKKKKKSWKDHQMKLHSSMRLCSHDLGWL